MKLPLLFLVCIFSIACSSNNDSKDYEKPTNDNMELKVKLNEVTEQLNDALYEIDTLKRKLSDSENVYDLANYFRTNKLNPYIDGFKDFYNHYAVLYTKLNYSKPYLTFYNNTNSVTPDNIHNENLVKYNIVNKFILEKDPEKRWINSIKTMPIERTFIYKNIESNKYIFSLTQPDNEESRYDLIIWHKNDKMLIPIAIYPFIIGLTKYATIDSVRVENKDMLYIRSRIRDDFELIDELHFKMNNENLSLSKRVITLNELDDNLSKVIETKKTIMTYDNDENLLDTKVETSGS